MDRRFTNVISTVADTALELRTGLAKYWRTRMALVDQGYRPELHYMRGAGPKWREAHARLGETHIGKQYNPMTRGRVPQGYRPDQRRRGPPEGYRIDGRRRRPPEEYRPNYRWLADQCRKAARTVSTQEERADLLDRAKTWDFLAEHPSAASSRST